MPGSNGVYCLGSNVSVWAMPPAIQSRMRLSARDAIFVLDASSRASEPASAARAAGPDARRELRGGRAAAGAGRVVWAAGAEPRRERGGEGAAGSGVFVFFRGERKTTILFPAGGGARGGAGGGGG